jgi:Arm DNA-binding domain
MGYKKWGYILTVEKMYPHMPLTTVAVRNSKPANKPKKLADEKGMFLLIHPNGARYWRLKYRFAGKEKVLALGVFPDVSLADARQRRDEARRLLDNGVDPANTIRGVWYRFGRGDAEKCTFGTIRNHLTRIKKILAAEFTTAGKP